MISPLHPGIGSYHVLSYVFALPKIGCRPPEEKNLDKTMAISLTLSISISNSFCFLKKLTNDDLVKGLRRLTQSLIIQYIFFCYNYAADLEQFDRAGMCNIIKRCYIKMRLYARGTNRKDISMVTLKRRNRKIPTIVLFCQKLKTNFIHSEVNYNHLNECYIYQVHFIFSYLDFYI